jgi:hypothetical protein
MNEPAEAEVGVCGLCNQTMIRTADDCWHPWDVEKACPPEPPGGTTRWIAWYQAGNRSGRPGREHWRATEEKQ